MSMISLATIRDYWKTVSDWVSGASPAQPRVLVNTLETAYREDFSGTTLNDNWQVINTGTGHTISVSNSELNINTGVNVDTETVIQSRIPLTIPFRTWFIFKLSQRITNQEFYLEVVNDVGDMVAGWMLDGTSTNTGKYYSTNAGISSGLIGGTIVSSSNYGICELDLYPDEVQYSSRQSDSTSAKTSSYVRTRLIPDPKQQYYVRIRVKNLSTAPASSTTFTLDAVAVQDITELTAEITGGRGGTSSSQAIPMYTTGGSLSASVSGATTAYASISQSSETTTPLGADATYTGTSRLSSSNYSVFRVAAFADQVGTLYVEQSRSSSSGFRVMDSIAVNPNEMKMLEVPVIYPYCRVRFVNGNTAQGVLDIYSVLSSV